MNRSNYKNPENKLQSLPLYLFQSITTATVMMPTATVTRGQSDITPILQVTTPGLRLQTAHRGSGARPCAGSRRVQFATDVVEYLFYQQLYKVLEHCEIKQQNVVVLETFQKLVRKNILPHPEFHKNNKYILQQTRRPVIQQYQPRKLSAIITQSQPHSLAQTIRQLPSAARVQVLSLTPPANLAYLLQRMSGQTLGGIVSQISDNTLVAILSQAPADTLAEYMS